MHLHNQQLQLFFGGTFDPCHNGHLAIACAARDLLACHVVFVPLGRPAHRITPIASAHDRLHMLYQMTKAIDGLSVSDIEIQRAKYNAHPSYTFDTLSALRERHGPSQPIGWLLGEDAWLGFRHWHRWNDILGLAHLVIAKRRPITTLHPESDEVFTTRWVSSPQQLIAKPAGQLFCLHQPLNSLAARQIRAQIASGASDWKHAMAAAVVRYIIENRLYFPS